MTMEENKRLSMCEIGCKRFTGGEVKHDKNCYAYNDSLSKMYDNLQSKLDHLRKENEELKQVSLSDWKEYTELKHHAEEMAKAIDNALKDHDNRTDAYKAYQMLKQALINFQKWIIAG